MSTRRFVTVRSLMMFYVAAALSVLISCKKAESPAPASTAPGAVKSGTVAAPPVDLSGEKIREIIKTQGVEAATRTRLGNSRAADGTVAVETTAFKPSDRIFLTMWIPEAPRGLQTRAEWFDETGKLLRQDRMSASGDKVVTFEWTGKPLKPGKYHVTGYWGGNVAAERDFTVVPAPEKARAKKKSK